MEKAFKSYNKLYYIAACLLSLSIFSSMMPGKRLYAQANDSNKDYKIGAEDILHISVWENDHLNQEVFVRPDGKRYKSISFKTFQTRITIAKKKYPLK